MDDASRFLDTRMLVFFYVMTYALYHVIRRTTDLWKEAESKHEIVVRYVRLQSLIIPNNEI
jgi:hypothetical protein